MEPARKSLFDALDTSGKLDPVRAQLRAILFQSLQNNNNNNNGAAAAASTTTATEQQQQQQQQKSALAQFPAESLLIHELIREYLQWSGMNHSLSVFQSESKLPAAAVPKKILSSECGVASAPKDLPLLFAMLHECKNRENY